MIPVVEDELRGLTVRVKKLLHSLMVWQQLLLYLLPVGSRLTRLWLGWLCANIPLHWCKWVSVMFWQFSSPTVDPSCPGQCINEKKKSQFVMFQSGCFLLPLTYTLHSVDKKNNVIWMTLGSSLSSCCCSRSICKSKWTQQPECPLGCYQVSSGGLCSLGEDHPGTWQRESWK